MARKNSNTAVEYVRIKKDFDYSKNSLKSLEEIVVYYSNDILKVSNRKSNMEYGCYIWFLFRRSNVKKRFF